ncbi:MAG: hypothetical protein IT336_04645 [Thermomicrobiales bacterium]|nr:hypothetical protein [Thermomicrobiales bacterium]
MVTAVGVDLAARIATYEATKRRGRDFLLANIERDGEVADSGRPRVSYYRVPWALQVCGETAAATGVLDWIERTRLDDAGEFHAAGEWNADANRTVNTYPETILAYGAVLLRRFDIARRTMSFASRFQDPETGGIYMNREETGADGRQLLFPTCQFGMSAVMSGRIDEAVKVGEWLERLWRAQPELPERLYTIWSRAGGLAVDVPGGENARHYVNEAQDMRQYHYNGGIAAACLAHLHLATGDSRWIELARKFQQFSMESTPEQFETRQVCKSAWGSSLIAMATGDESYVDWLTMMGDWFSDGQEPDGHWNNSAYLEPNPPLAHQIEITAEFVVHIDSLIAALGAVAARRAGLAG